MEAKYTLRFGGKEYTRMIIIWQGEPGDGIPREL